MTGVFDNALERRFTDSPELVLANVDGVDVLLIHNVADGLVYRIQASVLASFINSSVSQADILAALSAPNGGGHARQWREGARCPAPGLRR